jgi:snapalysin
MAQQAKAGRKVTAVTVTYAVDAPSFQSQINSSTSIWNSSVSNVKLVEGSNYDFYYTEGNDPRGSYASTDGHGSGYVFLDYARRSSTTRPGSPPTRPATCSACPTTTPAPAPN